jgi:Flp pilus assembly protein CpaB
VRSRSNLLVLLGIAFLVVGGLIVWLITSDDDDGGAKAAERVTVVVASADVAPGDLADDLISENKLRTEEIDPGQIVAGAIGSLNQLQGATFTQGFSKDQQITSGGLQLNPPRTFEIPKGFDAVAVQLDFVPGVAAYVSPGDHINLYGSGTHTELVLSNVEVLDVDLTIPPRRGTATDPNTSGTARASTSAVTYLLALKPADVEKVVFLTENQGLYASLVADDAAPAGPTEGQDAGTIFNG